MEGLTGIRFPDYLVILSYFLFIILVGHYFSKYIRKAKDFFAAGNSMPWWLAGTSFYMASFSTLLFVIYNEISYKYGFVAVTICWIGPVAMLVGGYFTAHRWRRARTLTPISFIERRYNKLVHQIFVWTGFPLRMFDNALKIYSTAIVLMVAMQNKNITFNRFVIILGILMIAYTYMGGMLAVMITDFVQAVILSISVIMLFALTVVYSGGFGNLVTQFPDGFLNLVRKPYDWSYLLFTVFAITLLTYNASWALVQKYNCVRSEQDARKMIYYIALLMFIFPPIFFFPGMAARVILPKLENAQYAYAAISLKILPLGLMGFILSAMLSATLSTLGSEYNTLSGVLTRDFYRKIIKPDASEKQEVFFGRISTLVIGTVTMFLAIIYSYMQGLTLMDIMYRFFSAFGPPIMLPLIAGLLFKKVNSRGVICGMLAGTVIGVILIIINFLLVQKYADLMAVNSRLDYWLRSGWNSTAAMLNITATIIGMWIGSVTKPTPEEEKRRVETFFTELGKPYEIEPADKEAASPFRVIGITLALLGCAMIVISCVILIFYLDRGAFGIDLGVGIFLILLGIILRFAGRPKLQDI